MTDFDLKSQSLDGLVDEARLRSWLDVQGLEPGAPLDVKRLSLGLSNEAFVLRRGAARWVLRRPARVALDGADRGMRREFRVLSALDGTPVPHPRPLAFCDDPEVIGCVFYVMEHVEGWSALEPLPRRFREDPALRREAALATAGALGELAGVDWQARGLEDFGKPAGFHERQVGRWLRQLDSYRARDLPGIREVGRWLEAHRPRDGEWTPGILHGDFHAANVLVAPDPPGRVAAILDWENSTIGDPLLDLGGFLRMWFESERATWATPEEMIEAWESRSGRQAPDLRYHAALSAFRLAVLAEGVYQRSIADPTRSRDEKMAAVPPSLVEAALRAIAGEPRGA